MLSTYLGKIVRNLSFNLYKKNRAKKRGAGQLDDEQIQKIGSNVNEGIAGRGRDRKNRIKEDRIVDCETETKLPFYINVSAYL